MEKLLLLDSNSLINRAYYALPLLTNKEGQHTGAIFGYVNMLLKLIENYKPTHIIATFDRKAPTFRKEMYAEYKGTRKPMPDELASQLQPLKDILRAMNIPIVECDGLEADDLIGTFAKRWKIQTYIVTGDRDSLQLIDDTTTVVLTKKGVSEIVNYDVAQLASEGLRPSQIIDLKSLMGDSADNIPGVPGVGEKTAMSLLTQYDTLDGVYQHIDELKGKLQEKLVANKELAYLSYQLATIKLDCDIEFDLDDATLKMPFDSGVKTLFRQFEFNKLADKMAFVESESNQIVEEKEKIEYQLSEVVNLEQLEIVVGKIKKSQQLALEIGKEIFVAPSQKEVFHINIAENLFGEGIDYNAFLDGMKAVLQDENIKKFLFDSKTEMHVLDDDGIELNGADNDEILKAYLCDANRNYKNIAELANACHIDEENPCVCLFELDKILNKELQEKGLVELYRDLELPLVKVLFKMEKAGFVVDKAVLKEMQSRFGGELEELQEEIFNLAGKSFNINSTKQLATVLFDDLGLKSGKKTKTGFSTNVDVLNSLKAEHPIVELLLRHRELSKLKSTYLDGLEPLLDSRGAVHTIFKQTVTATGRLSSTEPNLQNIPIRKPEGKEIRKMFVASKGNLLVSADYSQIELRLMAEFSGDETMRASFNNNIDIHATTASQVLNVPLAEVTADQRRQAKAVNFGIIYGISDFGLSEDLGIPVWQAREFIERYFVKYPAVKKYMDNCIKVAKEKGYSETILKRRRDIPELKASNYNLRSFGERVAMNAPLQGSASDIIKLAMIKVDKAITDRKLGAKLIMQVHDELIVDTPASEVEQVKALLVENMENAVKTSVKLVADCGIGKNWLEAK
ncbi:MAG: DNA polymerase I [Clostridia bacterium]